MKITPLGIDGAWLIESQTYPDDRGIFREWYRYDLSKGTGIPRFEVMQANTSISAQGVIRGLHFSSAQGGQSKIVTCTSGSIMDVVVDFRKNSPTFGKSVTVDIDAKSGFSLYVSSGLGHGFQALTDLTSVTYLLNAEYNVEKEFAIYPLDLDLAIDWKITPSVLSARDSCSPSFKSFFSAKEKP